MISLIMARLAVVPIGTTRFFKKFLKEPLNFLKDVDLCYFMNLRGFVHHSNKIATGAIKRGINEWLVEI